VGRYRLDLLGGFALTDAAGKTLDIRSKKGRCLLAYLALSDGRAVARDTLAALLWGDRGDTQARRSLSQELYRLRGLFPEEAQGAFILEAESVALDGALFEVDALRLEAGEAGAAALDTGELLAGLSAGSEGFDEWLRDERERLRERAIAALSAELDQRPDAAPHILALEPANEAAHRALMRRHAEAGRRDLALKQYDKCREALRTELGIEPDAETRALAEEIKAASPQPAVATAVPEPESISAKPAVEKAGERRQVTVLAAGLELKGGGGGALDPEDRRAATRICRDVAAALLERHGSAVARTMGDSLLAYFGYPEAREDDAARAAQAALEIVGEIAALDLPAGAVAQSRAAIASGLVIAGEDGKNGADGEEALIGEAPDAAARLLQAAGPGMVALDDATRELLAAAFAFEPLAGNSAGAWRLAGETQTESRFAALRGGALTPFVGRELELQTLQHRWGQAVDGEGQAVLISGEPGIGKSRIAETLNEQLADAGHLRVIFQCTPNHTNSALHPVIEQMTLAAAIAADDSDAVKLDKLEAMIARSGIGTDGAAPLLADLLSVAGDGRHPPLNLTPQARKDRTLEVIVAQLTGLAAQRPVLFVFEDLHWADPTTRELLDLVVAAIEEARVLALFTFRPEYEAPWVGQAHVTLMALNRLAKRQCGEMVRRVAAEADLSENVLADIVAKTDGVPLFVEELTKTMLAGGVEGGGGAAVPATIQASLTARLDRLGEAREVAQIAAVIGREFTYPLLAATVDLGAKMEESELNARLDALTASELVFARGRPPTASYLFKHALIRDAAYDSLLRAERRALHGRIARALKTRFPYTETNSPELLAHHHSQAGEAEQALTYWQRAGERALEHSNNVEAVAHFRNGLEEISSLPAGVHIRKELNLQLGLGSALVATEGFGGQETGKAYM
jgi:DNA-binding SARP family transcriptional activator